MVVVQAGRCAWRRAGTRLLIPSTPAFGARSPLALLRCPLVALTTLQKYHTSFGGDLAARKNALYLRYLREDGVRVNPEMVAKVARYKAEGVKTAVASGSKNAKFVLERANLFDVGMVVDGNDVEALGLKPKPASDIFVHTARCLGVPMEKCIIFEDSEETLAQVSPAHGVLVVYP